MPTEKVDFVGRRRARALIVQGLYQYQLTKDPADSIWLHLLESPNYSRCDKAYFDMLWRGVTSDCNDLLNTLSNFSDREIGSLSPVEQGVLLLGAWEMINRLEIPYKIIINEAIDLAKIYGGTDGHKFVNGVLDKLAAKIREREFNN
ncbi:MAG: transcription antitermination factor NusB [Burkholderiales bacterium]|jgi:N utilization substance protein B|nr:transcription antitermination factor NusB [Burkholderiales bacterium]